MNVKREQQKSQTIAMRQKLSLVSAILLFIAAGIGLYLAWKNITSPSDSEIEII